MEYLFLLFAFICGLSVKLIGIPPLVGFLIAGFVLNGLGYAMTDQLQQIADLGITIMLFSIGLKLNVKDLSKREVYLGSTCHTLIWVGLISAALYGVAALFSSFMGDLSFTSAILIAFALSFSSTVCVFKVLEESGEAKTRHGKLAIGILVMQDVFAVLFLVAATGKLPSVWAFALLAIIPLLPLLNKLIDRSGHGELLPLTGLVFALGGYHLFELVNIKGDFGALLMGIMLAKHAKATELSKSLMGFKDLFLIGFFLSIGLTALPDFSMVMAAGVLCVFIVVKLALFFGLLTALKLRVRTNYLTSLIMSNYSEFGLIIGALAVSQGLLAPRWLVIIALAVSFSFVITSIAYRSSHSRYLKIKSHLIRFERKERLPGDLYPVVSQAEFLVIGMGRVGLGAFNSLNNLAGKSVWGMDADQGKIRTLKKQGLNVICGDGEDIDLWQNIDISGVKLILLALPSIEDAINITHQLKFSGYQGKIAAIARYEDEVQALLNQGVDKVFNFFTEAGLGFAEESLAYVNTTVFPPNTQ
ncbi:cation:proton antiporter family protein [Alteromonas sp. C1M14]|uniref:cation:proton antiporter family protein n=1 Tax=Alteromonas sp. C1M14 TaxID=2841567 RepID=UPI001C08F6EF|nr:cation:proton antiporter family protein [Alteromonas sp. C1M14]MBU2976866.1 cation:proton antiporter [Alteromonas sp. C1M14]